MGTAGGVLIVLAASLLVVRSYGWERARLYREKKKEKERDYKNKDEPYRA